MIKKGEYRIVNIVCISKSLYSQFNDVDSGIDTENDQSESEKQYFYSNKLKLNQNIYKAALQNCNEIKICYFIDHDVCGKGSIIKILDDLKYPFITKCNYKILNMQVYYKDNNLIDILFKNVKNKS